MSSLSQRDVTACTGTNFLEPIVDPLAELSELFQWRPRFCNLSLIIDVTTYLKIKLASCLCIFEICVSIASRGLLIMTNVSVVLLCHSCTKSGWPFVSLLSFLPRRYVVASCSLQLLRRCQVTDTAGVREWSGTGKCIQRHLWHSRVITWQAETCSKRGHCYRTGTSVRLTLILPTWRIGRAHNNARK